MNNQYIAHYYDKTLSYYKRFWHRDSESHALHYGFWEEGTLNLEEALLNENRFLARIADIQPTDKILDAGCGIGGSSIWLAKNIGATVIGITLSQKQVEKGREVAHGYSVNSKVEFQVKDYLDTGFDDNTFDVVWAIESICHADQKVDFLKEAYRILRGGGRLVVADGFLKRDALPSEKRIYGNFLTGLALSNLAKFTDFRKWMEEVGFIDIHFWDKTGDVLPSAKILYRRTLIIYPFLKIAHAFGFIPDIVIKNGPAGMAQYKLLKQGLGGYGIFLGKKSQYGSPPRLSGL